jgi:two-component system, LytTR family, response regulator
MRAYLVDDEPLAVARLRRLLQETSRVSIVGEATDPAVALRDLQRLRPDVLFLDVEMPGLSGFDLLDQLGAAEPLVVFVTAYDRYAVDAFKVNSVDYLLKPVEADDLRRAVQKLGRVLEGQESRGDLAALIAQMRRVLAASQPEYLARVPSRVGDRVEFVEVGSVSHFYAKDKLTFAVTPVKEYALDISIAELEEKLAPRQWIRIHRSTLLNVEAVKELHSSFGGSLTVRLKDGRTDLRVARDRAIEGKTRLGV